MRGVGEHLAEVLKVAQPIAPLDVVVTDAVGCILAEPLIATADVPAFPRAARDGYAVRREDLATASPATPVTLAVVDEVWSASSTPAHIMAGQALRVSTGVPVPAEADAIVPVEYSDRGDVKVRIAYQPRSGDNIVERATTAADGSVAIAAGTRMGARQIALAASLGFARVTVHPRPRVVIITVGDELEAVRRGGRGSPIYDANGPALRVAVQDAGATAIQVGPLSDDRAALREALEDQLVRADLVITTGGLSDGPRDTLRDVLAPLGTVRFDRVAMSPGRVHGVGVIGTENRVPIFALPGHPVAALTAFEVFVRPALRTIAGYSEIYRSSLTARAATSWQVPPQTRQFVPVGIIGSPATGYEVAPMGDPEQLESLSISALSAANALAVVPEEVTDVARGMTLHCLVLDG
ncbi:molybdopterin molybdotransferase MoeA [Rarobacter faecitabidus]|uniref:Molybdopterin molybdenumtransferase n=1 Tax=Rarobacter faecitabidus TaxID=13243 RepID=A0A542ZTQ4_RARFA|nr:gephyrin-like molybdotransferase Glp [Rarobacter faecitabidus]TQL63734.1 molybdopterin molybdotransferase [Rarobacter faecitabidus]